MPMMRPVLPDFGAPGPGIGGVPKDENCCGG
jgi:hypothetical protein